MYKKSLRKALLLSVCWIVASACSNVSQNAAPSFFIQNSDVNAKTKVFLADGVSFEASLQKNELVLNRKEAGLLNGTIRTPLNFDIGSIVDAEVLVRELDDSHFLVTVNGHPAGEYWNANPAYVSLIFDAKGKNQSSVYFSNPQFFLSSNYEVAPVKDGYLVWGHLGSTAFISLYLMDNNFVVRQTIDFKGELRVARGSSAAWVAKTISDTDFLFAVLGDDNLGRGIDLFKLSVRTGKIELEPIVRYSHFAPIGGFRVLKFDGEQLVLSVVRWVSNHSSLREHRTYAIGKNYGIAQLGDWNFYDKAETTNGQSFPLGGGSVCEAVDKYGTIYQINSNGIVGVFSSDYRLIRTFATDISMLPSGDIIEVRKCSVKGNYLIVDGNWMNSNKISSKYGYWGIPIY